MRANEEETIITSIRAREVACGLRRIPVGFYAAVHHSGLEWRTENKPLSVNRDVIEWSGPIPIPSDPLTTVWLEVYASFEFQPMLGVGEQLRKLSITVEQLLARSAQDIPFTFFPKAEDVLSPCSAISVTAERRRCYSSTSVVRHVQRPTTGSLGQLEDATDEGHAALSRYRKHGERWDLDRSIESFERALRICSPGHPCRAAAQANLAMAKFVHFQVHGTDMSLDVSLNLFCDALGARPVGHVDRPSTLIHLAAAHLAQLRRPGYQVDGGRVEILLHGAVQLSSPESYENRAARFLLQLHGTSKFDPQRQESVVHDPPSHLTNQDLHIFSVRLLQRFEQFGDLTDLQQAIAILKGLVSSPSVWDDRYTTGLVHLGSALSRRFERLGELDDLEDAISMLKQAVDLTRDGHPHKPARLNNFCVALVVRFERLGKIDDLNEAISRQRRAIDLTPDGHADKLGYLNGLGVSLRARFEHLGQLGDLEDAISILRDAVTLTPHGHPDKPDLLNNLGITFFSRFKCIGALSDLENAISMQRDAVNSTPDGHRQKPGLLNNLGNSFFARFEYGGGLDNLEDAISAQRNAVALTPDGHPDKLPFLSNLGTCLRTRFERLGDLDDLIDAVSMLGDAVALIPYGHPHLPGHVNNLANCFIARFARLGELHNLEDAIRLGRDVVALTPHGHPHRSRYLNNLGTSLRTRFERLGELSDLEAAISMFRDAIELIPHGHPEKPDCLNNLGTSFFMRFERLGEPHDLTDAILTLRNAIDLIPRDHPHMPGYLTNLGYAFKIRYDHHGELSDIENAISRQRDAVSLVPQGHFEGPRYLNNLGISFIARFERLGELSDLEDAISILEESVDLSSDGHPHKPSRLSNLGDCFVTRFERLGDLNDLEHAILAQKDAVGLTPHGHADRPRRLFHLGHSFLTRFEQLGDPMDLQYTISLYCLAASSPLGPVQDRFNASRNWISCARRMHHHTLLHAYSVAINLLPQLAWAGLSLEHRYAELTRGADSVREASAAALDAGHPEIAVEWLERGRSIVWGELFQLRSSYEELSSVHPNHAHRLREVSTALDRASATHERSASAFSEQAEGVTRELEAGVTDRQSFYAILQQAEKVRASLQQEAAKHRALAMEREKVLQEIRELPGFEQFLLRKQFSRLRASAHAGPIVILNAAESRCDALVILADLNHVIHVPLQKFTFKRSAGLQSMLEKLLGHARGLHVDERVGKPASLSGVSWESLLSTMWNDVVKPVLDALAFLSPGDLSRIFWCPTGPFTFLPIHAAGLYGAQHFQPGHKIFDFVVSSYAPTLSVLAPSPNPVIVSSSDLHHLLVVRQPSSDGLSRLPGVVTEVERIRAVISSSSTSTTLLESSIGTVEEVLELLKEADWCHFACHGIQDTSKATNSGLCLADGRRLTLRDIIALSRPRGGLAFLSACETAMGDETLSDEAIHIAAGMLFAGYGGVIGTMWSISDKLAPDVASGVYARLFRNCTRPDYWEAARALHEAIGSVRDGGKASFVAWLPFIHVGL